MDCITGLSELKGKTIERAVFVDYDEKLVIVFADNIYAIFEIEHGYEGDVDIVLSTDKLEDSDRLEVGFISQEEYNLIQEEEKQKIEAANEACDRRKFEQLKKKYEGGQ